MYGDELHGHHAYTRPHGHDLGDEEEGKEEEKSREGG